MIFNEYRYLNFVHKNGHNYEITPFLMVFVHYLHPFSDMDPDPDLKPLVTDPDRAKVPDPQH
jgi:hypothetical protein